MLPRVSLWENMFSYILRKMYCHIVFGNWKMLKTKWQQGLEASGKKLWLTNVPLSLPLKKHLLVYLKKNVLAHNFWKLKKGVEDQMVSMWVKLKVECKSFFTRLGNSLSFNPEKSDLLLRKSNLVSWNWVGFQFIPELGVASTEYEIQPRIRASRNSLSSFKFNFISWDQIHFGEYDEDGGQ